MTLALWVALCKCQHGATYRVDLDTFEPCRPFPKHKRNPRDVCTITTNLVNVDKPRGKSLVLRVDARKL